MSTPSSEWCNCQAVEGSEVYPGPWHPAGDPTCEHREVVRAAGFGAHYECPRAGCDWSYHTPLRGGPTYLAEVERHEQMHEAVDGGNQ